MLSELIKFWLAGTAIIAAQYLVYYLISRKNKIFNFKENLVSAIGFGFFLALGVLFINFLINQGFSSVISVLSFSAVISFFWFFINPLYVLIFSNSYKRSVFLESKYLNKNSNYKVIISSNSKYNAYATGLFPFSKIIILGSYLLENLNNKEVNNIIQHEIGHHKNKHLWKAFALSIFIQCLGFFLYIYAKSAILNMGFHEIISVILASTSIGVFTYYLPNRIMYYLEYEADVYAANQVGPENYIETLKKLDHITKGLLSKGNINHPKLSKRIEKINIQTQ